MNALRVLVVSHAHPGHSLGGAEVASHNLHLGLNDLPGVTSRFSRASARRFPATRRRR